MTTERIEKHPILNWQRGKSFVFSFNGKEIIAYESETIAMALHAAGIHRFSRSFKYYRPRGLYCANGYCNSCMMRVDGVPNVRTCITKAKNEMIVETQDSKPWFSFLFLPILRNFGGIFTTGFQYLKFTRPKIVRTIFEKTTRQFAGSGEVPEFESNVIVEFEDQSILETEILTIGGGVAGLSAALSAAKTGANILVVEEKSYLGGNLTRQTHLFSEKLSEQIYLSPEDSKRGFEIIEELISQLKDFENVNLMTNSQVTSYFDEGMYGLSEESEEGEKFHLIKADQTIIATGAYDRSVCFENNDLPGIMTGSAIQTLIHTYGVKPGEKAIIVAPKKIGYILARNFLQAGINVEALICINLVDEKSLILDNIKQPGVPIYENLTIEKALGKKKFEGLEVKEADGEKKLFKGDILCLAGGFSPAHEIAQQIGAKMIFCKGLGGLVAIRNKTGETTTKDVFVAGNVGGIGGAYLSTLEGKIAGIAASEKLGKASKGDKKELEKLLTLLKEEKENPVYSDYSKGLESALKEKSDR